MTHSLRAGRRRLSDIHSTSARTFGAGKRVIGGKCWACHDGTIRIPLRSLIGCQEQSGWERAYVVGGLIDVRKGFDY
jgi:hypothetical protein